RRSAFVIRVIIVSLAAFDFGMISALIGIVLGSFPEIGSLGQADRPHSPSVRGTTGSFAAFELLVMSALIGIVVGSFPTFCSLSRAERPVWAFPHERPRSPSVWTVRARLSNSGGTDSPARSI